jgi:hypothetical protein
MGRTFFAGLDLGQRLDPTALAVVERGEADGAVRLRHLERMPLGLPYTEVVERLRERMRSRQLSGGQRHVVVDGTGVGSAVVDLLRREDLGSELWPVTITAGGRERYANGYYRVPKRELIVGLEVLLEQGGLLIAEGMREGAALVNEMAEMRVKRTGSARERYGVWRAGEHDDLVLAVALACWGLRRAERLDRTFLGHR